MKIGVYTGAFNPVHNIHIEIIKDMIDKYNLSKIYVMPCGDMYKKKDLIKFKHRYLMFKIAISNLDDKYRDKIILSKFESKKLKRVYTYESLDYVMHKENKKRNKQIENDIYFITGADNFLDITSWMKYTYLLSNYNFMIVDRDNKKEEINILLNKLKIDLNKDNALKMKDIQIVNIKDNNLSSTLIRKSINKKIILNDDIDKDVYKYIKENKLYIN